MALDATVGGSTSDSYVTLVEADAYFANHYSLVKTTAWAALSSGQKEAVLRRACQVMDSLRVLDADYGSGALPLALIQDDMLANFSIHRLEPGQVLSFPRNVDLVLGTYTGFIPQLVMDAQCEEAIYLLTFDESALVTRLSGIRQQTVAAGNVRVSQAFSAGGVGGGGTYMAPLALELMRPFLRFARRMQRA